MSITNFGVILMIIAGFVAAVGESAIDEPKTKVQVFGKTAAGKTAHLYVLRNKGGMEAAITDFGASLVSLRVPDRRGKLGDVVLGYDGVSGYENGKVFLGATIGRYGNRIAKGKFALNGVKYTLATNDNGLNHLHGGLQGFSQKLWEAKEVSSQGQALELTYRSKDGEEGYPGNLTVRVTYTLSDKNELRIDYFATSDKETVVNLTNHSYFNLTGDPKGDILGHRLTLYASRFTPVDSGLIPTGELRSVKNTPFDFTTGTAIGARIDQDDKQLKLGKGYDHNFVIDRSDAKQLVKTVEVYEPVSGRAMDVYTTEPGIQFYSGNFLNGSAKGKAGVAYAQRTGFCLESQHFPDSPNKPDFPSTTLKPGQEYRTTTVYQFSAH